MVAISSSCEDDNIVKPDNILYSELVNVKLTSIDRFEYKGTDDDGECYGPVPIDSTAYIDIDLNMDGEPDFKIQHSHWYGSEQTSMHYWCMRYNNYSVYIESYNDNQISVNNSPIGNTSNYIQLDEPINSKMQWESESVIAQLYGATCQCWYSTFDGDGIIGLKLISNNNTYFGWLNVNISMYGITIYDYAVNLAENKSIKAGQKE